MHVMIEYVEPQYRIGKVLSSNSFLVWQRLDGLAVVNWTKICRLFYDSGYIQMIFVIVLDPFGELFYVEQ